MNGLNGRDFAWRENFRSSQLTRYGYHAESKTLAIEFVSTGTTYHYADVPQETIDAFDAAESKGSYFIHNIKRGQFRYERQEV